MRGIFGGAPELMKHTRVAAPSAARPRPTKSRRHQRAGASWSSDKHGCRSSAKRTRRRPSRRATRACFSAATSDAVWSSPSTGRSSFQRRSPRDVVARKRACLGHQQSARMRERHAPTKAADLTRPHVGRNSARLTERMCYPATHRLRVTLPALRLSSGRRERDRARPRAARARRQRAVARWRRCRLPARKARRLGQGVEFPALRTRSSRTQPLGQVAAPAAAELRWVRRRNCLSGARNPVVREPSVRLSRHGTCA